MSNGWGGPRSGSGRPRKVYGIPVILAALKERGSIAKVAEASGCHPRTLTRQLYAAGLREADWRGLKEA